MNCLNNSLEKIKAKAKARTEGETGARAGVGLQNNAEEVIPKGQSSMGP